MNRLRFTALLFSICLCDCSFLFRAKKLSIFVSEAVSREGVKALPPELPGEGPPDYYRKNQNGPFGSFLGASYNGKEDVTRRTDRSHDLDHLDPDLPL